MTNAISSHGTLLKMADRSTHLTFASVAEVLDQKGPSVKGIRQDATNHSSGGWVEKIPVLKDGGKVTFDVHWLSSDATQNKATGLLAAALAQTKELFQIVYPDLSGFQFWAYVDADFEAKVKDKLKASFELDITGAVVPL